MGPRSIVGISVLLTLCYMALIIALIFAGISEKENSWQIPMYYYESLLEVAESSLWGFCIRNKSEEGKTCKLTLLSQMIEVPYMVVKSPPHKLNILFPLWDVLQYSRTSNLVVLGLLIGSVGMALLSIMSILLSIFAVSKFSIKGILVSAVFHFFSFLLVMGAAIASFLMYTKFGEDLKLVLDKLPLDLYIGLGIIFILIALGICALSFVVLMISWKMAKNRWARSKIEKERRESIHHRDNISDSNSKHTKDHMKYGNKYYNENNYGPRGSSFSKLGEKEKFNRRASLNPSQKSSSNTGYAFSTHIYEKQRDENTASYNMDSQVSIHNQQNPLVISPPQSCPDESFYGMDISAYSPNDLSHLTQPPNFCEPNFTQPRTYPKESHPRLIKTQNNMDTNVAKEFQKSQEKGISTSSSVGNSTFEINSASKDDLPEQDVPVKTTRQPRSCHFPPSKPSPLGLHSVTYDCYSSEGEKSSKSSYEPREKSSNSAKVDSSPPQLSRLSSLNEFKQPKSISHSSSSSCRSTELGSVRSFYDSPSEDLRWSSQSLDQNIVHQVHRSTDKISPALVSGKTTEIKSC